MVDAPLPSIIEAFTGSTTRHYRRVEIFESDGVTRWAKDTINRFISGSVNVDYSRDERRTFDMILDNSDGGLQNAPGEFWYDKVIKIFRGVYLDEIKQPRVAIIVDSPDSVPLYVPVSAALMSRGFTNLTMIKNPSHATIDSFDILVGVNPVADAVGVLLDAYALGRSVFTFGENTYRDFAQFFGPVVEEYSGGGPYRIGAASLAHPVAQGWSPYDLPDITPASVGAWSITGNAWPVGVSVLDSDVPGIHVLENPQGGQWVMHHLVIDYSVCEDEQFRNMTLAAMSWLNRVGERKTWEAQVGEFLIDKITEARFPRQISISGRDYAKKCLSSRFPKATAFTPMWLHELVATIAGGAGISKRAIPNTGVWVPRQTLFDRGTDRWEAMMQVASDNNYELFFDPTGTLVMREFRDPVTSQPAYVFKKGLESVIVDYEKSTSDTRIYNHVIVTGESSDTTVIPMTAEVINTDPDSPTNIWKIGDRAYEYVSSFFTEQAQLDAYAAKLFTLVALEENELKIDSLLLPWLEVGDIIQWIDPRPAPGDPDTFLLTSLDIPLGLGVMSGTGKRLTDVRNA